MKRPKICVLDGFTVNPGDNPWSPLEALGELTVYDRSDAEQIVERAMEADVVLTNKVMLSTEILAQLPNVKFVSVLATGYNVVDVGAARSRGIPVSNVPVYSTRSVAQFVFALLLDRCHRVGQHSDAVMQGKWTQSEHFCFWETPQMELAGKTMGIIGFGRIGRDVSRLAAAFGMKVLVYSRTRGEAEPGVPMSWVSLDELASGSDVVSIHCPLTPQTEQLVNEAFLAKMKRTAILVNTSRGAVVDETALANALNDGVIAGAALDVATREPINGDNPLLTAKNVTVTPHMAWATLEARQRLMQTVAENVRAFLAGNPINVVN